MVDTSFVEHVHGLDVPGRHSTDRSRKLSEISLLTNCKRLILAQFCIEQIRRMR